MSTIPSSPRVPGNVKTCTCVPNIFKTESGELQFPSAAAKGCDPGSCLLVDTMKTGGK